MCQPDQKSIIERAFKGELKLKGIVIPKKRARPSAMSEYPEKSKYKQSVLATIANQENIKVGIALNSLILNNLLEKDLKGSASKIFLEIPMVKKKIPRSISAILIEKLFLLRKFFILSK
jgi:hypothetical protein